MEHNTFKRDNYIVIQGFMVVDLGLSGNELNLFALIHGFSQDGVSHFHGSLSYISSALNVTRANAKKIIDRLIEKGLVRKREIVKNGVKYCDYKTTVMEDSYQNDNKGVAETTTGCNLFDNGGGTETIPNNIVHNDTKEQTTEEIIADKRAKLRAICEPFVEKYGRPMVEAFIEYWGEANGKRLRWEVKKAESGAFEFGRRLANWASKEYNQPRKPVTPASAPSGRPIWESLGMTREQYLKMQGK